MKMRHRRKSKLYDPDYVSMKMGVSDGQHSQKLRTVGRFSIVRKSKIYYEQKTRI